MYTIRKIVVLVSLVSVCCLSMPTYALAAPESDPIDIWLEKEIEKDYSTVGMRNATNKAREMWDKELNVVYKKLMSKLSKSDGDVLRESQRNWIKFRDSEGKVISQLIATMQGTMWQMTADSMWMNLTRDRTLRLRDYYNDVIRGSGE